MKQTNTSPDAMRLLRDDITNRTFKPCYLLYGTESYLIRQYRQNLIRAIVPETDSMNLSVFTGNRFDEQSVIDLAQTMPFFNDYRLIVMEDSGIFHTSCPQLSEYLTHIPESTIFLFTEYPAPDPKNPEKAAVRSVDKRSKAYKAVLKCGFAAAFETPSQSDLIKWTAGRIRREGKKITDHTLRLFLDGCADDMNQIENELEKLLSYTLGKDRITDRDVEEICGRQPEDHIFKMIDAISMKDRKSAFAYYADLCELRTPPGRILYLISEQYRHLIEVRELRDQGKTSAEIAAQTGLRSFAADKYCRISNRCTTDELNRCLAACAEAEEAFKTGKMTDRISLELLITELSA